jgi:hypothetical protein
MTSHIGHAIGGTWPAPRWGVRHLSAAPRALALGALAACLAVGAAAAPAAAQIAGVPTIPRARRAASDALPVSPDSASRAARTSAPTPEAERQRLDIQAWVDSAAGALARSAPPPIPPPGSGARTSIFADPAVPDSLRPGRGTPVSTPTRAPRPRATRPRTP